MTPPKYTGRATKLIEILTIVPLWEEAGSSNEFPSKLKFLCVCISRQLSCSAFSSFNKPAFQGHTRVSEQLTIDSQQSSFQSELQQDSFSLQESSCRKAGWQSSIYRADETLTNAIFSSCHLVTTNYHSKSKYILKRRFICMG